MNAHCGYIKTSQYALTDWLHVYIQFTIQSLHSVSNVCIISACILSKYNLFNYIGITCHIQEIFNSVR